ncbi:SHOCT domain-containing protein [Streptomyces sp. KR80]
MPTSSRPVGGGGTDADELTKLSALKDKGELSEAEFQRAKEKVLH